MSATEINQQELSESTLSFFEVNCHATPVQNPIPIPPETPSPTEHYPLAEVPITSTSASSSSIPLPQSNPLPEILERLIQLSTPTRSETLGADKVLPLLPKLNPTSPETVIQFFEDFERITSILKLRTQDLPPYLAHAVGELSERIAHLDYPTARRVLLLRFFGPEMQATLNSALHSITPLAGESFTNFADRFAKFSRRAETPPSLQLFLTRLPPSHQNLLRTAHWIHPTLPFLELIELVAPTILEPLLPSSTLPRPGLALSAPRLNAISVEERARRIRDNLCLYCGLSGHAVRNCPDCPPRRATPTPSTTHPEFSVPSSSINSNDKHYLPIFLATSNSYTVTTLIDSGATDSFISLKTAQRLALEIRPDKLNRRIVLANDTHADRVCGIVTLEISLSDSLSFALSPLVIPSCAFDLILGIDTLSAQSLSLQFSPERILLITHSHPHPIVSTNLETLTHAGTIYTHSMAIDAPRISAVSADALEKMVDVGCPLFSIHISPPSLASSPLNSIRIESLPTEFRDFAEVFDVTRTHALPPSRPGFDLKIQLIDENVTALPDSPIYRLSEPELAALKDYIQEMLRKGHINPSESSAGAAVFFVKKKNGDLRLCVDYRPLNRITIRNRFPVPLPANLLDAVRRAKPRIFSKIDLKSAFNLLRVHPADVYKTAFKTAFGLFEYKVMPFGLTNAPPAFQKFVESLFAPLLNTCVVVYIDDILIFSQDRASHIDHVKAALRILQANDLTAQLDKSEFFVSEIAFLGLNISPNGIAMEKARTETMLGWEPPRNAKGVQSFLGFINFYRDFIPDLADLAAPLYRLTRRNSPFNWTPLANDAFEAIKKRIDLNVFLHFPVFEPNRPLFILADASDFGVGAVLCQSKTPLSPDDPSIPDNLLPISVFSRALRDAEIWYDTPEKELLSIKSALEHWDPWIRSSDTYTRVVNDHRNLEGLTESRKFSRRLLRWNQILSRYDFKVVFAPAYKTIVADALSRREEFNNGSTPTHLPLIPPERLAQINTIFDRLKLPELRDQFARTPPELYRTLNSIAKFDFDPAPAERHPDFDAFSQPWGLRNYVNPPYDNVKNWLLRAIALSLSSQSSSLFLLPTRIEARYFSEIITYFPVLLLDRPITFVGYKRPAHWASMLVIITPQDSENFQNEKTPAERIFSAHFTSIESFLSSFWTPHIQSICSVIRTSNVENIDLIMEELKTISSTIVPPRNFTLVDGLLKDTSGRIFVPSTSLQSKILHAAHDRNHLGSQATYTVIAPNFYWPGIHTYTKNFVRGCQVCPRIKSLPRNYGLLHPLPIPNSSWEDIGMDHIVGLPLSNGFDAILTVVDRFSKMAHFIPARSTDSAEILASQFLRHIFRIHGRPRSIISDRGVTFVADFWVSLCALLNIKISLSSGNHPQTNGMAEATNKNIEPLLRLLTSSTHEDWFDILPIAEFSYNSTPKRSIGNLSPFQVVYGKNPAFNLPTFTDPLVSPSSSLAHKWTEIDLFVKKHLTSARDKMAKQANKSRTPFPPLSPHDLVYLSTKNLDNFRSKLDKKFIGPFEVIETLSPVAVRLKLPKSWKNHPVFHVSELRPYHPPFIQSQKIEFAENGPVDDENSFEVEKIVRKRGKKYLVKWVGWPEEQNSWVDAKNLNCPELLSQFEMKIISKK